MLQSHLTLLSSIPHTLSRLLCFFFFYCFAHHHDLHSFPTRRSSDLCRPSWSSSFTSPPARRAASARRACGRRANTSDRKSTRLNSSHANISYAVFCLKKKKTSTCNIIARHGGHQNRVNVRSRKIDRA